MCKATPTVVTSECQYTYFDGGKQIRFIFFRTLYEHPHADGSYERPAERVPFFAITMKTLLVLVEVTHSEFRTTISSKMSAGKVMISLDERSLFRRKWCNRHGACERKRGMDTLIGGDPHKRHKAWCPLRLEASPPGPFKAAGRAQLQVLLDGVSVSMTEGA